MATSKLGYRREHDGSFASDQQQRLAQQGASRVNTILDMIAVLQNRAYAALAIDTTIGVAAYATLLTAAITSLLKNSFLIITVTVSGVKPATTGNVNFRVTVDGVAVRGTWCEATAGLRFALPLLVRTPVVQGLHVVNVQWLTNAGSARVFPATNIEEHASLLVQESAT